jgi:DNA-binding NarL/FixJ family response regulator
VNATTIVLVEDHQIVLEGLRALLETEPGLTIVGQTDNGSEAAQLAERLRPDVMIVDLMLPGLNGLEVTRLVSQRSPQSRVIILSMYDHESFVVEALKSGAAGYVLKRDGVAHLVQAVHEVRAGRRYLSPSLSERALEAYILYVEQVKNSSQKPVETLTPREREVLHLAAQGYTNAEIAAHLVISPRTVEVHRANMMRKLGLRTQADLIRFAIQQGVLPR